MAEQSAQQKADRLRTAALEAAAESRLHEVAAGEIAGLEAEGIELTADQVVWIDRICRKFDQPHMDTPAAGEPQQAGNVWLWPFTIQASRWYTRAVQWFDGDDELEGLTLAFTLAHSRAEGVFEFLPHPGAARPRIEQWALNVAATTEELILAVNRILHVDEGKPAPYLDEDVTGAPPTDAEIIAHLCAQCPGTAPEMWERLVCKDFLWTQIRAINAQNAATGSGDEKKEYREASRELGWAVLAIRQAWSATHYPTAEQAENEAVNAK
jgi:hypothetical protein